MTRAALKPGQVRCDDCHRPMRPSPSGFGPACHDKHFPPAAPPPQIPARASRRWQPDIAGQEQLDIESEENS